MTECDASHTGQSRACRWVFCLTDLQEAYEEAVTSYVENFGMDATTAQIEAREEFALQGFDISSIATSSSRANCNTFTAVVQTFLTSIYPLAEVGDETWGKSEEDKLTSAIVSFESYLSDQSVLHPNIVDFACTAGQREIIEVLLKFCCKTTLAQALRDRALNCLAGAYKSIFVLFVSFVPTQR